MKDITAHQNMQHWQTITDTVILIGGQFDFAIVGNKLNQSTARLALKNLKVTRLKTTHFVPSNNYEKSNVAYRYGFNGQEKDDEVKGSGNSYTTLYRQNDPRLGRWLSIDPRAAQMPWQSPYNSMDNNPILYNDPLGDWVKGAGILNNVFKSNDRNNAEMAEKDFKDQGMFAEAKRDEDGKGWNVFIRWNIKENFGNGNEELNLYDIQNFDEKSKHAKHRNWSFSDITHDWIMSNPFGLPQDYETKRKNSPFHNATRNFAKKLPPIKALNIIDVYRSPNGSIGIFGDTVKQSDKDGIGEEILDLIELHQEKFNK